MCLRSIRRYYSAPALLTACHGGRDPEVEHDGNVKPTFYRSVRAIQLNANYASRAGDGAKVFETLNYPPLVPKEATVNCSICFDDEVESKLLKLGPCSHAYCNGCMVQYLRVIALETKKLPVPCPGCTESLDIWRCVELLSSNKAERAADALSQLAITQTQLKNVKYCSKPECSTPFEYEGDGRRGTARVNCPLCKTSTCVLCSQAWHVGPCRLVDEEEALKNDERYRQCPSCYELIEREDGCNFLVCRCGAGFCFRCGVEYLSLIPTATNSHGTPGCHCSLFQDTGIEAELNLDNERIENGREGWRAKMKRVRELLERVCSRIKWRNNAH